MVLVTLPMLPPPPWPHVVLGHLDLAAVMHPSQPECNHPTGLDKFTRPVDLCNCNWGFVPHTTSHTCSPYARTWRQTFRRRWYRLLTYAHWARHLQQRLSPPSPRTALRLLMGDGDHLHFLTNVPTDRCLLPPHLFEFESNPHGPAVLEPSSLQRPPSSGLPA